MRINKCNALAYSQKSIGVIMDFTIKCTEKDWRLKKNDFADNSDFWDTYLTLFHL